MINLTAKQRESLPLEFNVIDATGKPLDCTAATLLFRIKQNPEDAGVIVEKLDADTAWDKTRNFDGIFVLALSATDLDIDPGRYSAELRVTLGGTIVKTEEIRLWVEAALD